MPRVIAVDPNAPDAAAVGEAARVLRAGGLVGLPTETVYGLAAMMTDEAALLRIYREKGRPAHHPIIAHVLDEQQARALASVWPPQASLLAAAFWPGPLTLVVDRATWVPAAMAGGGPSIAVRATAHPVARAVLQALGGPVGAPSANRYQGVSPTTAAHVVKELGDSVDLVLDAGPCQAGIESTVVDVRGGAVRVLRPGAVDSAALRGLMPEIQTGIDVVRADQPRASPGMDARHYAPRAPLRLASTPEEAARAAGALARTGKRVGLIVREVLSNDAIGSGVNARTMPREPAGYAHVLYAVLHELDESGVDVIVVHDVPEEEAWAAIANRLHRAAQR